MLVIEKNIENVDDDSYEEIHVRRQKGCDLMRKVQYILVT